MPLWLLGPVVVTLRLYRDNSVCGRRNLGVTAVPSPELRVTCGSLVVLMRQ